MNKKKALLAVFVAAMLMLPACGAPTAQSGSAIPPQTSGATGGDTAYEEESEPEEGAEGETDQDAESTKDGEDSKPIFPEVLKSFEITIDDTVVKLPMKYTDFEALGFVPDAEDIQKLCEPNGDLLIFMSKGEYKLLITAYNGTAEAVSYKDTVVTSIDSSHSASDSGNPTVLLPGGLILWESTIDDALALYGEPAEREDDILKDELEYTFGERDVLATPPIEWSYTLFFRAESGRFVGFDIIAYSPLEQ